MELLVLAEALPSLASNLPAKIDLGISRRCNPQPVDGEIVVCARPDANVRYRYRDLSVEQATILPRAEVRLNDRMSIAVTADNANVGGFSSQRAMVHFKLRF
ncbi:hypothetical protein [Novosphingobium sp.]|uniref:hypothetical protein n=1 Tax=Novosphingobium sp. TaxID=1874826 RepID=UPI003BAB82D3